MPIKPAITPAITPAGRPATPPDLPEWEVRLTMDVTKRIRAMDEDEAIEMTWGEVMDSGEWGMDIQEVPEDENGAS